MKKHFFLFCRLLSLTLVLISSSIFNNLRASEYAWEMGAGLVGINLPLYPGSSQSTSYLLPFPYFRLESKYLDVDRGITGKLFTSSNVRFSLSGGFGVPVDSSDSAVRVGMPDLDLVVQFGPSLDIIFDNDKTDGREWRMEIPLRLAVATDIEHTRSIGWLLEPRLVYESNRIRKAGWAYEFTLGTRFATSDYHAFYYDVEPQYTTTTRPAFTSPGGYSALFSDLILSWRHGQVIYFTWLRYQYLGGTVYEQSPLVEQDSYFFVGAGLNWIFAESL